MAEQICPVCGCFIGEESHGKEGIIYCCESCATEGQCGCSYCTIVEREHKI